MSRLRRSPSPIPPRRSRSRSPIDDTDRKYRYSTRTPESRSPSPSREDLYSAARYAAEHAVKRGETDRSSRKSPARSPIRDRSVSPISRTTSSSEKLSNGFPSLQPGSGIAAALQNVLQAGQSPAMQQVLDPFISITSLYQCARTHKYALALLPNY